MLPLMRSRPRRLAPLALFGALTLASACNKDSAEKPSADAAPTPAKQAESKPTAPAAPAPLSAVTAPTTDSAPIASAEGVIATIQIPTGTAMTDLAAVIDNLKPGASALLKLQAPAMIGEALGVQLSGAKLDGPLSAVVLDPRTHTKPIALLVQVEDAAKLSTAVQGGNLTMIERDGFAVIGAADVIDEVGEFALSNLVKAPDHSEIVIYPKTALALFRGDLEAGIAQFNATMAASPAGPSAAKFMELYFGAMISMVEQTDRVVVSVGASQASSDVFLRLYPTANTTLAAFTVAQSPADHALLAKLPGGDEPPALLSGKMVAGDARDELIGWSVEFMASIYNTSLTAEQWQTVMGAWLDTFDGRFATAVDMDMAKPAFAMRGLLGSTDSETMRKTWRELAKAMTNTSGSAGEMMGMRFDMSFTESALEVDDVPVDLFRTTIDASAMPAEQQAIMQAAGTTDQAMHFATFDGYAVMASAEDEGSSVRAAIEAARGKAPSFQPSPDLTAALESSKQNGESLIYYINFAKFLPPGSPQPADLPFGAVVMGMGKHGDALSMRVSLHKKG